MRIFVITGAGVSAESGLGTFRDKDGTGIWARFDPMKLATPEAFARDPHEVYAFYNARRQNLIAAKPNVAHFALARLEMVLAERRGKLALVTQNVYDLHERDEIDTGLGRRSRRRNDRILIAATEAPRSTRKWPTVLTPRGR